MSMAEIKDRSISEDNKPVYIRDFLGWTQNLTNYPDVIKYLSNNNCLEAFDACPQRFYYDRVRSRVVFCEFNTVNSLNMASGRSLVNAVPKWYKYVANSYFYIPRIIKSNKQDPVVIVEDCASACSAARVANSLALCGTSYDIQKLVETIESLELQHVIVCLDADAKLKSMKLQRDLLGLGKFRSVRIITPYDDLKYLSKNNIYELIYGDKNVD